MDGKVNYGRYQLSWKQWLLYGSIGMTAGAALILVFYHEVWLIILSGAAGAVLLPLYQRRRWIEKRSARLREEFKEALYSLVVSLKAGRSLEGAFESALEDLDPVMMPYIYREWGDIVAQMKMGFPVEECLEDFGERSGIAEIRSFARTIEVSKRSEGDVSKVMENTIHMLQDRMEIQQELKVLLAKKKTEQKILNIMPVLVIAMLLVMSPDYLAPLYNSLQGGIIMTVCAGLTIASYVLSGKIADITL